MEVLNKITQLKAELDSLRPLDKDREAAIMQKLRLDWNYHSNHLEGNSLTFGETKALILFGITAAGKPLKDHFEMTGHDEAVKWVEDIVKEGRPLTENFIRELHELLLKEPSRKRTKTPDGLPGTRVINIGVYKTVPNHVETVTGEIFRFATPEETPAMMHDLIEWYRKEEIDPEKHPLLLAAEFHYKFIRIHPFDDGNGRTARILMNFILMKYGYPPVVVKTEDKANYIAALQQSDAGIITPFIEYIGQNLAHSLEIMLRGARGENIDEPDDVDKEIVVLKQKLKTFEDRKPLKKSKETKIQIFNDSLTPLFNSFINKCKELDELYSDKKIVFFREGNGIDISARSRVILTNQNDLDKVSESNEISLEYSFNGFTKEGFGYFSYRSEIKARFMEYEFRIEGVSSRYSLTKPNNSVLSSEEVNLVIASEIKKHTEFINQQIELAQKKSE